MSGPIEQLSPRSVALGHLIDMYCTYVAEAPGEDFPLEARQQLALIMVQQVNGGEQATSVIEPSCRATLDTLNALPRCFVAAFEQRLHEMTEPDDLWTLMTSLGNLIEKPELSAIDTDSLDRGPSHLDRASVLGMFVRRLLLSFRRSTFELLCTLTTHFGQWVRAPPEVTRPQAAAAAAAAAMSRGSANGAVGGR